jgi:hypothetical protein
MKVDPGRSISLPLDVGRERALQNWNIVEEFGSAFSVACKHRPLRANDRIQ